MSMQLNRKPLPSDSHMPNRANNTNPAPRFSATKKQREDSFARGDGGMLDVRYLKTRSEPWKTDADYLETLSEGVVWDHQFNCFVIRREMVVNGGVNNMKRRASSEQTITSNCMLDNGLALDVTHGYLVFQNGSYIHGPTGQLFSVHGTPMTFNQTANKEC